MAVRSWRIQHELRRHTVCLSFGQNLRQINNGFANEIGFTGIIGIASQFHSLATLDFLLDYSILRRRRRRSPISFSSSSQYVLHVFIESESDFFVPLWMLTTTFDGLGSPFLTIYHNKAVWILLADVSLVWKMVLEK